MTRPKRNSPAVATTAVGAKQEPANASTTTSPAKETESPTSAAVKPQSAPTSFDQFMARDELQETLDFLRGASQSRHAEKLKRYLLECRQRGDRRMTLAWFADGHMSQTFVATVEARGFKGRRRTVLLKDIRVFGVKFILEDHLWVSYDRHWAQIEPFYQGQRVVLVGTATEYARKDSTRDFTVSVEKITKL